MLETLNVLRTSFGMTLNLIQPTVLLVRLKAVKILTIFKYPAAGCYLEMNVKLKHSILLFSL